MGKCDDLLSKSLMEWGLKWRKSEEELVELLLTLLNIVQWSSNIDLNSLQSDVECDSQFLKFLYKIKQRCEMKPDKGLYNFLMKILE